MFIIKSFVILGDYMENISTFKKTDLFSELNFESIALLENVCSLRKFKKKDILFTEGSEGTAFFLLKSGTIQLLKIAKNGDEIVIKTAKEGEMFAEVILFEKNHYPVTALAIETSEVLMISKLKLLELLEGRDFRNDFFKVLMKKQRYLANRIRYLSSYDTQERFLLFLRDQYGEKAEININFSKKHIAKAIGAAPETFSRVILRLKKHGLIKWESRKLKLKSSIWKSIEDLE